MNSFDQDNNFQLIQLPNWGECGREVWTRPLLRVFFAFRGAPQRHEWVAGAPGRTRGPEGGEFPAAAERAQARRFASLAATSFAATRAVGILSSAPNE